MELVELHRLLRVGESVQLEVKVSAPKVSELRRTVCAFANDWAEVGGGVLVIGVSDDLEIVGVSDADETQRALAAAGRDDVDPPLALSIEVLEHEGKQLVAAHIPRSPNRPHLAAGTFWIRIGSETRAASKDEVQELFRRRAVATAFEDEPFVQATVADVDWKQFEAFMLARPTGGLPNARGVQEVALAAGWLAPVAGQPHPTLAMLLLFGLEPEAFVPWAAIDFARFLGFDRAAPVGDRHTFRGRLREVVERCLGKVNDLSLTAYEFEPGAPQRRELHEYPFLVVREAIVNAVVHRDYSMRTATVTVWMFHDRVEVQSPGGLYGRVRPENFGHTTDYRNRRLAEGFYHTARMTEMIGRGVPFMRAAMKTNASPPPRFDFDPGFVQVTLPGQPTYLARRLHELGEAAARSSDLEGALALFERGLDADPQFAALWVAKGAALRQQGRHQEAEEAFRRGMQLDPGLASSYLELAALESSLGNHDKARAVYQLGARQGRRSGEILRAAARLEEAQGRPEAAYELLKEAARRNPEDWTVLRDFGRVALLAGHPGEAAQALRSAAKLVGEQINVALYQELLRALVEIKAPADEVKGVFDRLVEAQPRLAEAYQAYYDYLAEQGASADAMSVFDRAAAQGVPVSVRRKPARIVVTNLAPGARADELLAWLRARGIDPMGLELLSSGAGRAAFVEVNPLAIDDAIKTLDRALFQGRILGATRAKRGKRGKSKRRWNRSKRPSVSAASPGTSEIYIGDLPAGVSKDQIRASLAGRGVEATRVELREQGAARYAFVTVQGDGAAAITRLGDLMLGDGRVRVALRTRGKTAQ